MKWRQTGDDLCGEKDCDDRQRGQDRDNENGDGDQGVKTPDGSNARP
jgi:hypothetical protein